MLLTVIISEKLYDSSVDLFCSSFCFTAVQCPPLQELENGVASCRGDADMRFSYGNTCSFSCAPGYHLLGPSMVTCTSAAEWNERTPRCEGKSIPTVFYVVKKSFFFCFCDKQLLNLLSLVSHHLQESRGRGSPDQPVQPAFD